MKKNKPTIKTVFKFLNLSKVLLVGTDWVLTSGLQKSVTSTMIFQTGQSKNENRYVKTSKHNPVRSLRSCMAQRNDKVLQLGTVEIAMRPLCTFLLLRIACRLSVTGVRPLMWHRAVWHCQGPAKTVFTTEERVFRESRIVYAHPGWCLLQEALRCQTFFLLPKFWKPFLMHDQCGQI